MSIIIRKDPLIVSQIIDLVTREYVRSRSLNDWQGRLERVGYAIRRTSAGNVIETLPHHIEICALPPMPERGAGAH